MHLTYSSLQDFMRQVLNYLTLLPTRSPLHLYPFFTFQSICITFLLCPDAFLPCQMSSLVLLVLPLLISAPLYSGCSAAFFLPLPSLDYFLLACGAPIYAFSVVRLLAPSLHLAFTLLPLI